MECTAVPVRAGGRQPPHLETHTSGLRGRRQRHQDSPYRTCTSKQLRVLAPLMSKVMGKE